MVLFQRKPLEPTSQNAPPALPAPPKLSSPERSAPETTPTITVELLGGVDDLEVVGESYRQDELWRIVGGQTDEYFRQPIVAVLVAEPKNPYDPNAIAVFLDGGGQVGYLPKELAARYRPGLLALQAKYQSPIALKGDIFGGGRRDDGIGMLGVFLRHDPADFGFAPSPHPPGSRVLTGVQELVDRGRLQWRSQVSEDDDARAIRDLRRMLASETDLVDRHFQFCELERRLYHYREVFASALDEYDVACRAHDAEIETIVPNLVRALGGVPFLGTYRQAAIRHEHAKEWGQALWWAERGLSVYGDKAIDKASIDDLVNRIERCGPRVIAEGTPGNLEPAGPRPA